MQRQVLTDRGLSEPDRSFVSISIVDEYVKGTTAEAQKKYTIKTPVTFVFA